MTVEVILTAAAATSERDYRIIRTMRRTGMRVSELVAMTPSGIEEANWVIDVVSLSLCIRVNRHLFASYR